MSTIETNLRKTIDYVMTIKRLELTNGRLERLISMLQTENAALRRKLGDRTDFDSDVPALLRRQAE